ncbi:hypothetical protein Fuma_00172 [Fuerstiella marisgermanici]|uniref:Uncharacterized protein n=1 Tax=Fuerstiella marisgermanici TaxID=1891926 RepID=A0A1P8W948_9PLAN|nr:hypothetical protein [Fuerstiella marisgermanici]APZ90592.1 hypothetical protein Fuma_00172 [Fuerstiella marisgermanici]
MTRIQLKRGRVTNRWSNHYVSQLRWLWCDRTAQWDTIENIEEIATRETAVCEKNLERHDLLNSENRPFSLCGCFEYEFAP